MTDPTTLAAETSTWHMRLFKKSLTKQAKLRALERYVGDTEQTVCLDVGGDNGIIPYLLRKNGGTWISVDSSDKAVASMAGLLGEDQVHRIEGTDLPFEDDVFDLVVIIDYLEHVHADGDFIRECHRCLKPGGRLILNVPHIKSWSAARGLKKILGLTDEQHGHVRPGYRLRDIYGIAKDGFDIVDSHTYGGVFVESLDAILQALAGSKVSSRSGGTEKGLMVDGEDLAKSQKAFRAYSVVYPFLKLASVLDAIFGFTCNHYLTVHARSRPWNRRRGVTISDGRSIAEATIGERVGTARDF